MNENTVDAAQAARDVLEADRARREFSASNPFGAWDILGELRRTVEDNAPHLAHTVLRLAALADKLEQLAAWERTPPAGSTTASPYADGLDEAVTYIRIALNGETRA